jgi:hypothetical protein
MQPGPDHYIPHPPCHINAKAGPVTDVGHERGNAGGNQWGRHQAIDIRVEGVMGTLPSPDLSTYMVGACRPCNTQRACAHSPTPCWLHAIRAH